MKLLRRINPWLIVLSVVLISFFAHSYNAFRFPYFENDEGVYMSQAWSVLTQGKMAPYTYWYDHAPMGWFTIAFWIQLTGGFYSYGYSLHSGRVFMLVLQLINTLLVYSIAKRLTGKTSAGVIAALVFGISPLGIFFHRRILLDNIMTTYALLSFALLLRRTLTLQTVSISALLIAFGILSKENGIFFIPALLLLVFVRSNKRIRVFAVPMFIFVLGSVVSLYFLYAGLKNELFPYGTPFFGGMSEHVSLLTTLKYQASRTGNGGIFSPSTWAPEGILGLWAYQDPVLFVGGLVSTFLLFIYSLWKQKWEVLSLVFMATGMFYFFVRGGVVYEFYVVPILPFLAISFGIVLSLIINTTRFTRILSLGVICIVLLFYLPYFNVSRSFPKFNEGGNLYTTDHTRSQREALAWIREHVDEQDAVIFDNHFYLDLRDPQNPSRKVYKNSHWYWKVSLDPEIRDGVYDNNPDRIDYIAMTPQMAEDLNEGASPLVKAAVDGGMFYKAFNYNGWSVNIIRSGSPKHVLDRSWEWYRNEFITSEGRVVDKSDKNKSTSEGQSYAMLRAVWMNDRNTFERVYEWTTKNIQLPSGVFAWRWTPEEGIEGPGSKGSAPDADIDIALALLFASKRWGVEQYLADAEAIIRAIWTNEVAFVNNVPYVVAGDWAKNAELKTINPSYFSPYAFRIFAEVTKDLPWKAVVDSSYQALDACSRATFKKEISQYLPPDWCAIAADGSITTNGIPETSSTDYSYNAFRVPFRIALDYLWYQEPRALEYLEKLSFLRDEWSKEKKLYATYTHQGEASADYEAVAAYAGSLGAFLPNSRLSQELYQQKIRGRFYEVDGKSFWDDPNNYYTQNWGWFGTALYGKKLVNLWED